MDSMGRRKKPRTVTLQSHEDIESQVASDEIVNTPLTNRALSVSLEDQMIEETLEGENVEGSETPTEKRRGPTLMTHIWNQPKEKRIVLRWNKCWQPIGNERSDLAHFIGTIGRNPQLCPLAYDDWRLVPEKKPRAEALNIGKSKFIVPHPLAAKYVQQSMGKKWNNFKGELKLDCYEPHLGNVTNILKAKPDFVPVDQWLWLKRSEKNQKSRELQVMAHTGGSKSFACYADEKTINGVVLSRAMVYLDTHKERKIVPTPMDEKSKQAVEMIND